MPWCPRCDETFPQGPACPRCSARLIAREREATASRGHAATRPGAARRSRFRGATRGRSIGCPAPRRRRPRGARSRTRHCSCSRRASCSVGSAPSHRPAPRSALCRRLEPIPFEDAGRGQGVDLLRSRRHASRWRRSRCTTCSRETSVPRAQFSPPFDTTRACDDTTSSRSDGASPSSSSDGGKGYVAFAPHGRSAAGLDAGDRSGLASPSASSLVRHVDGALTRWTYGSDSVRSKSIEDADELFQTRRRTRSSVAARRSRSVGVADAHARAAELEERRDRGLARHDARAPRRRTRPTLWDGDERVADARHGSGTSSARRFEQSSERVAIAACAGADGLIARDRRPARQRRNSSRSATGTAARRRRRGTAPARWVYVAGGDGVLHAVEASGGRVEAVKTQSVGCGVAWVDVALAVECDAQRIERLRE